MADTALSALTATTALAGGDLLYVVDGGNSRKIDWNNVVSQMAAASKTLTNTTINTTSNTLIVVEADISDLQAYLVNLIDDATPQLGGDLDLNSKSLTMELTTDSGTSVAAGDVVYMTASGLAKADASAEATAKGGLWIALESVGTSASGTFARLGFHTTTGLTQGAEYYLSETAGAYTATRPSTSGAIVRRVGYALSTTVLCFDPDSTYVENA